MQNLFNVNFVANDLHNVEPLGIIKEFILVKNYWNVKFVVKHFLQNVI